MRKFNLHDDVLFNDKEGVVCAVYSNEEFDIIALDIYIYSEQLQYEEVPVSQVQPLKL